WIQDEGELIVFFLTGRGPKKIPRYRENSSLPRYVSSSKAKYRIAHKNIRSVKVLDIDRTSKDFLEDRIGRMQAAQLAGTIAKAAVGVGVAKMSKDSDLGLLTYIVLQATNQADLRHWRTLPAEIQMLRLPLKK